MWAKGCNLKRETGKWGRVLTYGGGESYIQKKEGRVIVRMPEKS